MDSTQLVRRKLVRGKTGLIFRWPSLSSSAAVSSSSSHLRDSNVSNCMSTLLILKSTHYSTCFSLPDAFTTNKQAEQRCRGGVMNEFVSG